MANATAAQWKCSVCGYVHEGDEPPETCPVCGAGAEVFQKLEVEPTTHQNLAK